jgi:hypothetical protein
MINPRNPAPYAASGGSILNPRTILRAAQMLIKHGGAAFSAGQQVGGKLKAAFSRKSALVPLQSRKSMKPLLAPVNQGTVTRSILKTPTFEVPFCQAILAVSTNASSVATLNLIGSAAGSGAAVVSLSPFVSAAGSASYPWCFSPAINRLAQSFVRYRVKPGTAKLMYRTIVPTSTAGSLAFEAAPPEYGVGSVPSYQQTSSGECTISTPVWGNDIEFGRKPLADVLYTGPEWGYCDFDGTVSQPEVRQDAFMNLAVAGIGLAPSITFGTLFMEGTFEFKHLNDELSMVAVKLRKAAGRAKAKEILASLDLKSTPDSIPESGYVSVSEPSAACASCAHPQIK